MSQCSIPLHMEPDAKRDEIVGVAAGYLRVRIAVQHDDDNLEKGNEELIAFLSRLIGIDESRISILQGKDFRIKLLGIDGLGIEQVMGKLKLHMKS
jgi:uncharacterized protein YggU (UPF0235/DUF167 family)